MEVAYIVYHYRYDLELDSLFVISCNGLFERFVYVMYAVFNFQCVAVRGVLTLYKL